MAESLTENLVDLLAGMSKENSIPSGEDTLGVNLKRKLGTGDSANYSDVHKRVQFALDQNQDDVSEMADDDGNGSNTNSNAVNSHKNDESAGSSVSHKRPGSTHHGGLHSSEHSSLSLPVTAADSPPVECHSRANSFSMTLQKKITTGTGRTFISLNFSHQKMCVW
jgi:hypothetical protein